MLKDSQPALYQSFLTARECHQRGDLAGAEAIYSRLLALDPADDELLFLFGNLKASKGEIDLGLECLRMAQQLKPSDPQIPYSIGVVLQLAGRITEAVSAYCTALGLNPAFLVAWENLCAAYYDTDDYESGLAAAEQALTLNRESPLAIRGAANCLTALGRRAEALAILDEGVRYHPAIADLRIHRSWELMANGRFGDAWRELEWRHARKGKADAPPRSVPYPRWNGEPVADKTILVYGEQGVGDEVMYAPYVLGLVRAGARCILECDQRLEQPFARAFPKCLILHRQSREQVPWHATLPEIDYCISALSLPLYFPHPTEGRPFLTADPGRTEYWRQRLRKLGSGPVVGVSWRGGADPKARKIRSIPPMVFGELIDANATFVSLQYGATPAEAAEVSANLLHFAEVDPLRDLDEFFAMLSAMDAVVSIDNSTVHFAGALGVRTLLLLPVYSEWRWGNQTTGVSPWYQSLEFVRQSIASEEGWRDLIREARRWLSFCNQNVPEGSSTGSVSVQAAAAGVVFVPPEGGRSVLLVGDTNYWHHWGCSCTSLGLHEGLRSRFKNISVLPLLRLLSGCPSPAGLQSLDAEDFFSRFMQCCPDVVAAVEGVDSVVINGDGAIHEPPPIALSLLYIAYVAKKRFGKQVALVNHSCEPGESVLAGEGTPVREFYAKVYKALDLAVVRDRLSLENVLRFGGEALPGFDCLPLFLARHRAQPCARQRKLVIGGSALWSPDMVNCFADLADWAAQKGFSVEILSGAKAFLAVEEVGFVEQMVRALSAKKVNHTLHFPISELEWLDAIGTASLVVSGRFHDSIAAAFQQVPFLMAESNTTKIGGLLSELGLEPSLVALTRQEYGSVASKARRLLGNKAGTATPERLAELRVRAATNFSSL